jgi:hypothetical protein
MKAISASDILRKSAPRETVGRSFAHTNRYDIFRDPSPATTVRSRIGSVSSQKRKEDELDDFFEPPMPPKKGKISEDDAIAIACMESNISKVSSLCNKITMDIQEADSISDPAKSILSDIVEALKAIKNVQCELTTRFSNTASNDDISYVSKTNDGKKMSYSSVTQNEKTLKVPLPSHTRRLPSGGLVPLTLDKKGKPAGKVTPQTPAETPEEEKKRKFTEAIKDAERSTLCFNLDMGNVPLQNKGTIQEKATLALTTMAARKENKNSAYPSSDAILALDDLTSMVTNMEFYGSSTKQYKGKTDKPFCTVPVKYQFKDRDVRSFAEKTLRDTCGVLCATPYPAVVRESIKQVVQHVKASYPNDFVRVNVIPKEFGLKVSRRSKGEDQPWITYSSLVPLPEEALDISLKKAPEGFRLSYSILPCDDDMEVSSPPSKTQKTAGSPSKTEKPKSPSHSSSHSPLKSS